MRLWLSEIIELSAYEHNWAAAAATGGGRFELSATK
ncbi:hypothetical protein OROGR_016560 [Orobanche gracilis]